MNAPREPLIPRILLLDIEPAMAALLVEWLAAEGVAADSNAGRADPAATLILIELPFPRQGGRERLARLAEAWPGVPVIVLSPTFLPGVPPQGEVARQLGAAAVLPSPLSRQRLCGTIVRLLNV